MIGFGAFLVVSPLGVKVFAFGAYNGPWAFYPLMVARDTLVVGITEVRLLVRHIYQFLQPVQSFHGWPPVTSSKSLL